MKKMISQRVKRTLLKKVQYLLSNTSLDKLFWAEEIEYASHLLNRLLTNAIRDKTPLEIWSGGAILTMVHLEYLVVRSMLMSRMTSWTLRWINCYFWDKSKTWKATIYGIRKQRVCLEQTCHMGWVFNGEAYRLPVGGDNEDQVRSITADGGWYYSTLSSLFSIVWDSIGRDTGWRSNSWYR